MSIQWRLVGITRWGRIIEEYPVGWRVLVFVLLVLYIPDECRQKKRGHRNAGDQENDDYTHIALNNPAKLFLTGSLLYEKD